MTIQETRRPEPGGTAEPAAERLACPLSLLRTGSAVVDGVAVVRDGGGVRAFANRCPHGGASLSEGVVRGGVVTCPRHGARYRLRDGRALAGPVRTPLQVFDVDVRGDVVHVSSAPPASRSRLGSLIEAARARLQRS